MPVESGLTQAEARLRLEQYGPNALPEERQSPPIAVYGIFMKPIGWEWALFVWVYALAWFVINDRVKLVAYRMFDQQHSAILLRNNRKAA